MAGWRQRPRVGGVGERGIGAWPRCYTRGMQLALLWAVVGGGELIAIVVVVVLLFGASRIPALARGIGVGVRELRDALKGVDEGKGQAVGEKPGKSESGEEAPGGEVKGG